MKKELLTQLLLIVVTLCSYGQQQKQPLSEADVKKVCNIIADSNLNYLSRPGMLVSRYTFRNLIKNDFSTVTIADNTATVGQFASLSIDPNTYKLAFSPIAWSPTDDLVNHDFRHVFAINVTATLSNQSLLNLKDWRTVTGSFSWTYIFKGKYSAGKKEQQQFLLSGGKKDLSEYQQIYDGITAQLLNQRNQAYDHISRVKNKLTALNHPEFLDKDDLKKAYMDSVSKYEQILTNDKWTSKEFIWLKLTGSPLSFDNAYYVQTDNSATFDHPVTATNWTPSINAAINYFAGSKSGWNFYWNANASYGLKDMFSQIYTPQTYDSFDKLTDISMIQKTNEQIFEITGQPLPSKVLPTSAAR